MGIKASMKILVTDDQGPMRKIIKTMLNQIGFTQVEEAEDGHTAWKKIQEAISISEPFEFILADLNMPNVNGLELLKKVRADEKMSKTPFLVITAEADQSTIVTVLKAGVNNFIVKPFSAQTLKEKISKIFNQ